MNGYELSRKWFDYCFENPEKIKPNHTALYFFAVEHCNRLGWKQKFGLPTEMAKDAIGVKSWHTYIKTFNELIDWGFFELIERSKNQYSSNIIALINYDEALDKALDKATTKHASKQQRSTHQSIDSIIKQLNKEQLNNTHINSLNKILSKYKITKNHLFSNSEYYNDVDLVKSKIGEKYSKYNLFFYHESVKNWADSTGKLKKDWIAVIRNFILSDITNNKERYAK